MTAKDVIILGIESSCDDTSAAILMNGKVLSNIVPVVDSAIKEAGIDKNDISAIAFTRGPGLLGSLLVGVSFAKSFGMALDVPLIEVNHMQAHILAHFIENEGVTPPQFPFICLTVSGGHTQIVLVKDYFDMKVLGETIDDAAGEAFDKAAKLLSLPYPGGPLVDKYAKDGDPIRFEFPISNVGEYDFSFSGLKTSLLYFLKKKIADDSDFIKNNLADICASYQHTIIKTLFKKLVKACKDEDINSVAIAGGVSANSLLRSELARIGKEEGWTTHVPPFEFCTDNGGMIAAAGYFKFLKKDFVTQEVVPNARLKF